MAYVVAVWVGENECKCVPIDKTDSCNSYLNNTHLAIHQFSRAAQRGGSGRQDRTILTMRRRPLVNQEVRLRATFLG